MMLVQNGIKFCFFLFLTNIISSNAAVRSHRNSDFLDKLLHVKKQSPVVVFLQQSPDGVKITDRYGNNIDDSQQIEDERGYKRVNHNRVDRNANVDNTEVKYTPSRSENDAYVLYSILRSTKEEEDLDPKAGRVIKTTQQVLRQAFALRCHARSSCEKKCPQLCYNECAVKKPCPKKKTCPTTKKPCVEVCKPKPSRCVDVCKKKYDELDACEEENEEDSCEAGNKPSKSNRGRTGRPKWLRSFLKD